MDYRSHLLSCPRCNHPLVRLARRETFTCRACNGVAIELGELIRLLVRYSSDLVKPDANDLDAPTSEQAMPGTPCPTCGQQMRAVALHGVRAGRCDHDELLWFDAAELDQMIDGAIESNDAKKGVLGRLRDLLFAN